MNAARRLTVATLLALVGGLLFGGVSALAAGPEAPAAVVVESIKAGSATFRGELNPGKEAGPGTFELGTYEFLYNRSATECKGGSVAPESPGISLGGGQEVLPPLEVTGLVAHSEYTVCLLARNGIGGEATVGPAVTFKTALTPETPVTSAATGVGTTSATLHGVLNPGGEGEAGSYEFLYAASTSECEGGAGSGGSALGAREEAVSSEVTGLSPNTEYTVCLLARNEAGETSMGSSVTFTTQKAAPVVGGESFSDVGSSGTWVDAQVDAEGSPTTYFYEYGTSTAYGYATSPVSGGDANRVVEAPARLGGLQPGTVYYFRVVASNESGTVQGVDARFTTLSTGVPGLPDGRVFEMVTPPNNENAEVYTPRAIAGLFQTGNGVSTALPFQASVDGEAVTYVGDPTVGGSGESGAGKGAEYLARRLPSGGWRQESLEPEGEPPAAYQAFSSDLSVGILESRAVPALSSQAPGGGYDVLYQRSNSDGSYQPLFTKTPPNRSPAVGEFSAYNVPHTSPEGKEPAYAGSTEDSSQLLFEVNDALTENAAGGAGEDPVTHLQFSAENNLYDSVAGRVVLVNVLPDGGTEANATFGAPPLSYHYGQNPPDFSHLISEDGSRIFWTDLNTGDLYVRENADQSQSPLNAQDECQVSGDACTVLVSAGGRFWAASSDGSKVFFTKEGPLYEYDLASGQTSDLSEGAPVEGVVGTSTNGSYVYFVEEGGGLYVWHEGAKPRLIAMLVSSDGTEVEPFRHTGNGAVGDWQPGLGHRTAEVAPNGLSVVFMSEESLTGYDNESTYEGYPEHFDEVYVYEVEGARHLFCVSCSPSGERIQDNFDSERAIAGGFLPVSWSSTYIPQWLTDEGGRVFFDSGQPLVSGDTNEVQDVYEWERDGTGSCREESGCDYLLSGGTSNSASWLLGASASGDDVFVISRAQLTPEDQNEDYDVFDARVGGVRPVSPPVCSGTGCQGVPGAPPVFATPSSETFNGVGNYPPPAGEPGAAPGKSTPKARGLTRAQKLAGALRVCRRQARARRMACRARARKRYGSMGERGKRSSRSGSSGSAKGAR
jgi:hypothetical protein